MSNSLKDCFAYILCDFVNPAFVDILFLILDLQLSYLGLSVDSKHQSLWFLSLIYPMEGETISDEFKVYDLLFERYEYPEEEN